MKNPTTGTREWKKTKDADLHSYDLRHEGASRLHFEKGVPLATVSALLGHQDLRTTQVCLNVKTTELVSLLKAAFAPG